MGMFGNSTLPGYGLPQVPEGTPPIATQPMAPQSWRPTGARNVAGIIGDVFAGLAGREGPYAAALNQRQRAADQQTTELQRQLALAQYKAQNPETTAAVKSLIAAGIDPRSPQGQKAILDSVSRPIWLGNPEVGYQNANQMDPAGQAPASDLPVLTDDAAGHAAFAALPSGAHFKDPQGNVRQK